MAADAYDLAEGVPLADVPEGGVLPVTVDGEPWVLARVGDGLVLYGGKCTHWEGPLGEGLRVGDTLRCPWHHACFDLKTGRALQAPAFAPLARRAVEVKDGRAFAGDELPAPSPRAPANDRRRIVVVGAGGAGFAAVDRLRALGHAGELSWFDADRSAPVDRPNLSKDYLAGKAPPEFLPLASPAVGGLRPRRERVIAVHRQAREVELEGGERVDYDALLLAPGARPKRPDLPGLDRRGVHLLRTRRDATSILRAAGKAKRAVVLGGGFIGLEVAASLRQRGLEVEVVAPEAAPLADRLGPELATWVRRTHEAQGVRFRLGRKALRWTGRALELDDGGVAAGELLVVGAGVEPCLELARSAGLAAEGAVPVGADFRTRGDPAVWAAGDVAAFPDALGGGAIRVEHWVAAARMGQIAAESMLGREVRWAEAPFFWSAHFDQVLGVIGHAERWDAIELDGDLEKNDAEARYVVDGRVRMVVTLNRDGAGLRAAEAFRREAADRS